MTTRTIAGIYRDGKVELAESPEGLTDGMAVTVTFTTAADKSARVAPPPGFRRYCPWDESRRAYPTRDELHDRHG